MGELTKGMKDKLHKLIDESNTDKAYILLQAIHESDLDVHNRITFDVTDPQMSFLDEFATDQMHGADVGTVLSYFIDTAKRGYYEGQAAQLMETAPKPGKGQREK